ncbi:MAG TPA: 3-oxo-5-alpha-steroid 4-dehydrogenase [Vicinamibacteria bacterium]|nr:3-oxo-5-alpha-steroid 4-dehydrogenase [Vicinamibacteria bacterium]
MSEARLFQALLAFVFVSGAASFLALLLTPAPYGRYARPGWGPGLPAPAAWAVMEGTAAVAFLAFFARGPHTAGVVPLLLLALWLSHYVPRAVFDPLAMRCRPHHMPLVLVGLGVLYNLVNAYLNATAIVRFGPARGPEWLAQPLVLAGLLLFAAGYGINRQADRALRALSEHGQGGYGLPRGGLYEHVSCPNYLGEILEWCGWALVAGTAAAWSFAFFTACNLVPRALAHHRWYRRRFPGYPRRRRALVPRLF